MQRKGAVEPEILFLILKCYRQGIKSASSIPEMSILPEVGIARYTLHEIKASEERKQALWRNSLRNKKLRSGCTQPASLWASQNEGTVALMQEMGTAKLRNLKKPFRPFSSAFRLSPPCLRDGQRKGRVPQ